MFKKNNLWMIVILLLFVLFFFGCEQSYNNDQDEIETITIRQEGSFSEKECRARGLNDKIIMIESKYCSHCEETLPVFLKACQEENIKPIIIDISEKEQMKKLNNYSINVAYTPTFIFGCDYYVGGKTKEEYTELINKFKEEK
ncbi:MAG: hypothetical protein ACQER9_01645 [Nanobdellota archaeon]